MDVFVRQNDSLWYYSQLFKVNYQLIIDSNSGIDPLALMIGQQIKIPGFTTTGYSIKQGDSLWAIARSRNLSLDALFLVNPNLNPNALQVGQTISVPLRITWRLIQGNREYAYETMMTDVRRLKTIYPFIKTSPIGDSVLERDIPEVLIGNGNKRVHYNGSFHANEWITTPVIMTFLNDYLLAITNQADIRGLDMFPFYQQTMLSIVPMVNPDGVELVLKGPPADEPLRGRLIEWNNGSEDFSGWKANINGVDLNDQFPAEWELEQARNNVTEPGPANYPGEGPLTQPEAIAMSELTKKRDFGKVLAFHTQGEVIFWGFEGLEPPESETIVNEFARVSGYEPVKSANSYAGYKDWFIQDWRRPGFTVELGKGTNPLPISQFDEIYQKSLGIFLAGLYM
ncbi:MULTISPECIES: M14 family metallopeptidase [Peribacillus]|jgi:g-D-glutamyl-meso-diaminopimelate peptidase|uniref:M14 family metallopeptidase n=1 Tax=Peribacillus TaxID=2675229 RepID=UPI0007BF5580|nr:M14 family metallopeptidase [Peribacillus frigoritolerans]MEB2491481.1 M14 family zinc carboxypeptidase [Peribacillus frigoritolerans]